jgi:hypothetical protein
VIPDGAVEGVYVDGSVAIPTGDAIRDAIYNMERSGRDYTMPVHITLGLDK